MLSQIAERLEEILPERRDFKASIPHYHCDLPVTVVSDLHLPLVDAQLFERMLLESANRGSQDLFIVGDFLDNNPFSRFPVGLGSKQQVMSQVRDVAHHVLTILTEHFERVYLSEGNHDAWFTKHLEGHLGFIDLIRWIFPEGGEYLDGIGSLDSGTLIYVNDLPTTFVTVLGQEWVFEHPGSYSRIRTNTARLTAEKYGRNAAVGHVHHLGWTISNNGQHYAVDLAGLYDPRLFDFPKQKPTNMPEMVSGFAILGQFEPQLFRGRSS